MITQCKLLTIVYCYCTPSDLIPRGQWPLTCICCYCISSDLLLYDLWLLQVYIVIVCPQTSYYVTYALSEVSIVILYPQTSEYVTYDRSLVFILIVYPQTSYDVTCDLSTVFIVILYYLDLLLCVLWHVSVFWHFSHVSILILCPGTLHQCLFILYVLGLLNQVSLNHVYSVSCELSSIHVL